MILDVQQRHPAPDVTVLEFSGRLQLGNDLGAAEGLIKRLVTQGHRNLVLDCSKLEAIDSAGLGMFLLVSATTVRAGGQFRLAALTERVTEVLKMTRVYETLSVHPDVDAALRSITRPDERTPPTDVDGP